MSSTGSCRDLDRRHRGARHGLSVGLVLAYLLRLLPTVRLQLVGLAFLAVLLPLGTVLVSGWVMFHMDDDVKILAVTAASALTAVVAALVFA